LKDVAEDVQRSLQKLRQIEEETTYAAHHIRPPAGGNCRAKRQPG
ncbi:hypothetical protein ISX56_33190, partial [Serratia ureilytica]|nr:hypothetical protein [Serratia ureilytica]